jgi:hypothetical protein
VQPVEVDGSQDIGHLGSDDIELGEQFDLAAGNARLNMQLSRDGNEMLLQHLQRHDAGPRTPVRGHQIEGAPLLCRSFLVVRVNEDIGV